MTRNDAYRGGSAHSARPPRGPARRIGWSAASHLIDGEHGADGGRGGRSGATDLDTLLAIAAAPAFETAADSARLETVLAAYRRAGMGTAPVTARPRPVRRQTVRPALVKCAAVFLVLGGSGVAAASAGILPAGVQQIAHDYLGGVGVPAPSSSAASPSSPSAAPGTDGSPTPPAGSGVVAEGSATASATNVPLCTIVAAHPQDWHANLNAADQSTLIAAAGGAEHVGQYCTTLFARVNNGGGNETPSVAPSPSTAGRPSPKPSPDPSAAHGNGHPSHSPSPNPHSSTQGTTR